MKRKAFSIIQDIGFILFLVVFPHAVPLPFYSYAVICFLAIFLVLRREGRTLRDLGLDKKNLSSRAILVGILSALAWVIFMQIIYIPVIKHLFNVPDYTEYNFIRSSMARLIMTIVAAWIIGGFYEEVVFRGYIQNILEKKLFKGMGRWLPIVITSILFGLYHLQQDIFAVIAACLGGLYWSILYKKWNNNLWVSIISHALFDMITLILIYTGEFGNLI
ncbi:MULTISPECIES: CPBP family intramembrane glutamic endopeptidase [Sphingobacterium]|uniref:CPBP family intramembrane metalloprotease n=1 Tax=Sphingobacterium multivorum TaxID=28454 RepID=A0ABX7CQZ2_SPHMU|nr:MULTISPECIES: type II CAAX endopeptidase family protein [Sphingobacterium]QQT54461.1 CPBP family intramembrane metalloprotease [Sphingobacterium multivorum]QRY59637.1 CPBP family intramembrane metalloprotease [Sphingobacterium siyangense]